MSKIAIEDLIQLLGMVGIIGSLIFVGLEMHQSQRIAVASQQQERAAITVDKINAFYNVWQAKLEALAFFYNKCNYRDIMTIRKSFFPMGLIEVIDSLPDECTE